MTAPEDDRPASGGSTGPPLEDAPTAGLFQVGRSGQTPRVRPGLVLAERYRVLRFLAQGGMGEIYEVEDLQLGEMVALKTVRAGSASDPLALERFKREIQLARRVTHPNVCRIFEFGLHRGSDASSIAFLTMELLAGETLLERLRRDGRMTPAQALPLVAQMCAGLDAAHRAGVVHRDFKSSNVLLVPTPDGRARAVVTDFGLAQLAARETSGLPLAEDIIGTLDYMAPEQIEGHEPTPAVDVYALGVVMFEMLTAARPFGGGPQATGTAVRRADEPAPSPRVHVPDIDPVWERAILRCLERDPSARFGDAAQVARAVSGEARPAGWGRGRKRAAGALLVLAGFGAYRSLMPAPDSVRVSAPGRRAVAVLPFKNLSGRPDNAWLATAFSEMLTTELAATERLRLVSGEDVARMQVELKLPEAETLAKDTLRRIQANLGSDVVVLGSYLAGPGQLRIDVRVQDAVAGETLAGVTETGAGEDVLDLVTRTGRRLRQALGLPALTPAQASELRATLPANPEATRLYAAGLTRLRAFDALAGRELLEKAVAADPKFPLAHAALADALAHLGYQDRARDEAKLAFEQGKHLPREERLLVEARAREMEGAWPKAAEIHRVLFSLFPDDLEHGLRLADAQKSAGRSADAFQTLATLRRLASASAADPRIDLVEAEVNETLGAFGQQRAAAQRAAARGVENGARLLVARARVLEAYAAGRLGLEAAARAAAQEARGIYQAAGDRGGLCWALNRMANVAYQQGRLDEALQLYEDAQKIAEQIGYRAVLTSLLNNASEALVLQGDLAGARLRLERARGYLGDVRDRRGGIIIPLNLTNLDAETGAFAAAEAGYARALESCRELGERSLEASVQWHWAELRANRGELASARELYLAAIETFRRLDNPRYAAYALVGLGRVERERNEASAARASQLEALAIRQRLGDRVGVAESRLAIAELDLDVGSAGTAAAAARELLPMLAEQGLRDGRAQAQLLLALAQDELRRRPEALEALQAANELAARSHRPRIRLLLGAVNARLRYPRIDEAGRRVREAVAESARQGWIGLELEARRAAAEIDGGGWRSLEQDARQRGFVRIAEIAARRVAAAP
jgi:TolB-like protein/tRNA A-37 threonylcarbamoyl transferase component Bud32